MPSIWTFGPQNVTGIDLSANAFWRVMLGATVAMDVPWLTLAVIYPPASGQTVHQTQITLARTSVPVTSRVEDVMRVAEVSISTGSLDQDISRMTEAFNLFKNNPRTKQEVLETSLRDALEILQAYWQVREWLFTGAKNDKDLPVSGYVIKLRP